MGLFKSGSRTPQSSDTPVQRADGSFSVRVDGEVYAAFRVWAEGQPPKCGEFCQWVRGLLGAPSPASVPAEDEQSLGEYLSEAAAAELSEEGEVSEASE
jgi:hypothetical protein